MTTHICLQAGSSLDKYPAKQHAQAVAQRLGVSKGLIYLPGQQTVWQEDSDEPFAFRQRRYFYYLSGVDERDCALTYDIGKDVLTLYIPFRDRNFILYNGVSLTVEESYDRFDVDVVEYTSETTEAVEKWTKHHPKGNVFILHPSQEAFPGQNKLPHVDFTKLQMAIDRCRVIKYPHEIKAIRTANDITAQAHRTVLTNIAGLHNEAQVEAIFKEICISRLAKNQAYDVIAAAGPNAATLHYMQNDAPLAGQQLMVLDAGCEWDLYASDVTRTFPLSGSWPSKEASAIYDLVQSMQDACIERVKPGVRFLGLHHLAHQIAVKGLLQLGLLHNGDEAEIIEAGTSLAFFPHGLGHHLGLEVHDVSAVPINSLSEESEPIVDPVHAVLLGGGMCRAPVDARSGGLEEGMVITIEPGIYFSKYAFEQIYLKSPIHSKYINKDVLAEYYAVGGVRIEDNILVTKSGYENLTTAPKGAEMLSLIRQGLGVKNVSKTPAEASNIAGMLNHTQRAPSMFKQEPATGRPVQARRLVKLACAVCRKRKLRCSGFDAQKQVRCANCIASGYPCYPSAQRGPQDGPRLEVGAEASLEKLFAKMYPDADDPSNTMQATQLASVVDPLPDAQATSLLKGFQQALQPQIKGEHSQVERSQIFRSPEHKPHAALSETIRGSEDRSDTESAERACFSPFTKLPQLPQKPLAYRQGHPLTQSTKQTGEDASSPTCSVSDEAHSARVRSAFAGSEQIHPQSLRQEASFSSDAARDQALCVAAVTATYVHSLPQNRSKTVTCDEISAYLDSNPSVDGLCVLLEAMGLQYDPNDLRAALIAAVPRVNFLALATVR